MIMHRVVAGTLIHILTWPVRVARARRDFAMLARLGERDLRDIGLTGQDLRDMSALPLFADATTVLAQRAKEREGFALRRNAPPPGRGPREGDGWSYSPEERRRAKLPLDQVELSESVD